jgi:hypothetical protein
VHRDQEAEKPEPADRSVVPSRPQTGNLPERRVPLPLLLCGPAFSNLVTACRSCNCSRQDKSLKQFAGPETIKDIKRHVARKIARYRKLAKALISGETGMEETIKAL